MQHRAGRRGRQRQPDGGGRRLHARPRCEELRRRQCKEGLEKVLADLDDPNEIAQLKSATVTGAAVTGDKATVSKTQITNVPDGYQNDIDLVKINGRWYIDSKQ